MNQPVLARCSADKHFLSRQDTRVQEQASTTHHRDNQGKVYRVSNQALFVLLHDALAVSDDDMKESIPRVEKNTSCATSVR